MKTINVVLIFILLVGASASLRAQKSTKGSDSLELKKKTTQNLGRSVHS